VGERVNSHLAYIAQVSCCWSIFHKKNFPDIDDLGAATATASKGRMSEDGGYAGRTDDRDALNSSEAIRMFLSSSVTL
jgi:hypothetical protein